MGAELSSGLARNKNFRQALLTEFMRLPIFAIGIVNTNLCKFFFEFFVAAGAGVHVGILPVGGDLVKRSRLDSNQQPTD